MAFRLIFNFALSACPPVPLIPLIRVALLCPMPHALCPVFPAPCPMSHVMCPVLDTLCHNISGRQPWVDSPGCRWGFSVGRW